MGKRVISVRLSEDSEEDIRIYAEKRGISLSAAMEKAVRLLISMERLVEYHDPDKAGIHCFIYLAPPIKRRSLGKPLVVSFIWNQSPLEWMTEEELKELRKTMGKKFIPVSDRTIFELTNFFETPEEALASVARVMGKETDGFSVKKFAERLKSAEERLVGEENGCSPGRPKIYGVLSGNENLQEFLKAREQDALEGTNKFRKMLSGLSAFVVEIPDGKKFRTSSLEEAERALRIMGYDRGEVEYSLLFE